MTNPKSTRARTIILPDNALHGTFNYLFTGDPEKKPPLRILEKLQKGVIQTVSQLRRHSTNSGKDTSHHFQCPNIGELVLSVTQQPHPPNDIAYFPKEMEQQRILFLAPQQGRLAILHLGKHA